jgi:hypothetical protein
MGTVSAIIALITLIISGYLSYLKKQEAQNTPQSKVDKNDNELEKALIENDDTKLDTMFNDVLVRDSAEATNPDSAK